MGYQIQLWGRLGGGGGGGGGGGALQQASIRGSSKEKECRAVRRPRLQRTRNYATRGRFPPTLVILHLGAVYWPTGFIRISGRIYMFCGLFVIV